MGRSQILNDRSTAWSYSRQPHFPISKHRSERYSKCHDPRLLNQESHSEWWNRVVLRDNQSSKVRKVGTS